VRVIDLRDAPQRAISRRVRMESDQERTEPGNGSNDQPAAPGSDWKRIEIQQNPEAVRDELSSALATW
jgi:hypothetical protein